AAAGTAGAPQAVQNLVPVLGAPQLPQTGRGAGGGAWKSGAGVGSGSRLPHWVQNRFCSTCR
ncbi:MAG: hypothetical protein WB797_18585, partial [Nocardioides sp.]